MVLLMAKGFASDGAGKHRLADVRPHCHRLSERSEGRGNATQAVRATKRISDRDQRCTDRGYQDDGKVKLNQMLNTTAIGAASGGFWGLLIGAIFLMPIFGAALGAASGALSGALTDFSINDAFMKDLAASLQPGSAALFVLIRKVTADKVLDAIKGTGGVVLKTSLDHDKEQALRDALTAPALATPASAPAPSAAAAN
jgi:uncharacterized membrane protein